MNHSRNPRWKRGLAASCMTAVAMSTVMPTVLAATPAPSMNLASGSPSVILSPQLLHNNSAASIIVGGAPVTFHAGQMVTAAESVAIQQVLTSGHQSIQIGANGAAFAGSLNLTPFGNHFSDLVIPSQVKTFDASTRPLLINNNLLTSGSLIGLPGGPRFSITAGDVSILPGGLITTIGPTKYALDLSIYSNSGILNLGSITSSGKLLLSAKNDIVNDGTVSGAKGVSLVSGSGNFFNTGSIEAAHGNVIFSTISPADITLQNAGGTISALNGNINFRTPLFRANNSTDLQGGEFTAKNINIYGGKGAVDAHVDSFDGILNITADSAHIISDGSLQLGKICLSGDPSFVSTAGNLTLNSNQIFPGQALALLAQGDVTATNAVTKIDLSTNAGDGGDLTIVAGYNMTLNPNTPPNPDGSLQSGKTATLTAISANGGDIDLTGVSIKTSTTAAGATGGNVLLVAAQNGGTGGNITVGNIDASAPKGTGGNVTTLGATKTTIGVAARPIQTAINTSGKTGGIVAMGGVQPGFTLAPSFDSSGVMTNTFNNVTASPGAQIRFAGNIVTSGSAGAGGTVFLVSDDSINGANIIATGTTKGGSVTAISSNSQIIVGGIDVSTAGDNSSVHINLSAIVGGNLINHGTVNGSAKTGAGADINYTCNSNIHIIKGDLLSTGGTKGGNITFTANTSAIDIEGKVSNAAKDNSNQSITLNSNGGNFAVFITGSVTGSGSAGAGADIHINANDRLKVAGDITSTGTTSGGSVTLSSTNKGITVLGGIKNSGVTNAGKIVQAFAANEIEIAKGINVSGTQSAGNVTLGANNGDIRVGVNAVDNKTVGATEQIVSKTAGVNVSSTKGIPGTVTIQTTNGGTIFIGTDVNASGVTSSGSSGNVDIESFDVMMIGGKVNTGSAAGQAGTITLKALGTNSGGEFFGIDTGAINSAGKTGGGAVSVDVNQGGTAIGTAVVRGSITTSSTGGQGGDVDVLATNDITVLGPVTAKGATGGGTVTLIAPHLLKVGAIDASSLTATAPGGAVGLIGHEGITVGGNILTMGSSGGTVIAVSRDGIISVSGNINTSAANVKTGNGGNAGNVFLNKLGAFTNFGSAVLVKGNIIARGGSTTDSAAGNGGTGGRVEIYTAQDANFHPEGMIQVGSIDARGGNTTKPTGNGGNNSALNVTLSAATVQLMNASAGGASINSSGGINGNKVASAGAPITVTTIGNQPIPANLDLLSPLKTEFALPGGMFEIGNSKVNGSAGILLTTTAGIADNLPKQVVQANTTSTGGNVHVNVSVNSGSFKEQGAGTINVNTGTITNGKLVRQLVSPSEAVALYQTSRNGLASQTFGVTQTRIAAGTDVNGAFPNIVTIAQPYEFAKNFTAFRIADASTNAVTSLLFNVTESNNQPNLLVNLSTSKSAVIDQQLTFIGGNTNNIVEIQLGALPLTITANGRLHTNGAGQILEFVGNTTKISLNVNGIIDGDILMFHSTKDIVITAGPASQILAFNQVDSSGGIGMQTPTGNWSYLSLGSTAAMTVPILSTFYEKNLVVGPQKAATGNPQVDFFFRNLETAGTTNISTALSVDILGSGHIYSVGDVNLKTDAGNGGGVIFGFAPMEVNVYKGSFSATTKGAFATLADLNVTTGKDINLFASGTIADLGHNWTFNTVKGNISVGVGNGPSSNLNLTQFNDAFNATGDIYVYGIGPASLTPTGEWLATGNVFLGNNPKLKTVAQGVNDIEAIMFGQKNATMEFGTGSNTTIVRSFGSNLQTKAIFHGSAAMTTDFNSQIYGRKGVLIQSDGDLSFGDGSFVGDANLVQIKAGGHITFANNPFIRAGQESQNASLVAPMDKSTVINFGTVHIDGDLGVDMGTNTGGSNDVIAVGGDIIIRSKFGNVDLGDQVKYKALGGNFIALGQTGVTGGTATTDFGNEVHATALVNGSKWLGGGGIEIRGGTQVSTIKALLASRPTPFLTNTADQSALAFAVLPSAKGSLTVGATSTVTLNASLAPPISIFLGGQNQVVVVTGTALAPVTVDSVFFTSATPLGASEAADNDDVIVECDEDAKPMAELTCTNR